METFTAVVQAGGMRKAAAVLNLSQPAISRAVRDLEETFGVPLLQRTPRGVEPTAFGLALVRRAGAMLDELDSTVDELVAIADPGRGTVRLGAGESIQAGLFSALIATLTKQYPRMRIEVESGQAAALLTHFLPSRLIDFAIARPLHDVLPPGVVGIPLFRERMLVGVGHAHPLARRRKVGLEELREEHWILSTNELMRDSPVMAAFAAERIAPPDRVVVSGSLQSRLSLLPSGRFVTLFPHTLFPFGDFAKRVKILPVELGTWQMPTMALHLEGRTPAPAAQAALELLLQLGKRLDREGAL